MLQRGHRHRQTRETNYAIDNNIGISRKLSKVGNNFHTRQRLGHFLAGLIIADSNHFWFTRLGLCDYCISIAANTETDYLVLTTAL